MEEKGIYVEDQEMEQDLNNIRENIDLLKSFNILLGKVRKLKGNKEK